MRSFFKKLLAASAASALLILLLPAVRADSAPRRIISLTPVGTEILFALGQGNNIAGVTEFCDTPDEAREKPKIGGFAMINLETLLAMDTDLIVMQDIHSQLVPRMEQLKIPHVMLMQNSVKDVLLSIKELGRACDAEEEATRMSEALSKEIADIAEKAARTKNRPRVLLSVSRELSEPRISSFYAAGQDTFYNELIELAGGVNALPPGGAAYPLLSLEGLIKVNPDVIIDLIGDRNFYHSMEAIEADSVFDRERLLAQWTESAGTNAAAEGRVHILEGTAFLRPGLGIGRILRTFARIIHPELEPAP